MTQLQLMDQLSWTQVTDDRLRFFRAIGVDCLLLHLLPKMADGTDRTSDFIAMRERVAAHGLTLASLHLHRLPKDQIVFGEPGREAQLERWLTVLRAVGAAGIPIAGTTFLSVGHFRTAREEGRGGARYLVFDLDQARRDPASNLLPTTPLPERYGHDGMPTEELWENFAWFWRRVVPVAQEAGVKLALHPDDPPVHVPLGGGARIVSSLDDYQRIFDLAPAPANTMLFCQGCVQEMGVDVPDAIRQIGALDKIALVHFRTVRGTPQRFAEVFVDEGDVDMLHAMQTYRDVGFTGPYLMDHMPEMPAPFDQFHGKAYANGYVKALIQAVYGRNNA
ncbi:MAG: Mannonate dehydratase [uncultured Chloroflexi bacterium]|uniref:mannonate dehydratase n=1 Tax=uncultured Chloroflexota bacterium TaxID=166587 RepID=A0A6J4H5B9_9CHLR|nr:MAG: Mannonate dehydratase [uncultured Chloroflexota bacterium]